MRMQSLSELDNASDLKIDGTGLDDLTILIAKRADGGHSLQVAWRIAGSSMTDVVISRGRAATLIIPAARPIKLIYDGKSGITFGQ